jgi:hypothetical protein
MIYLVEYAKTHEIQFKPLAAFEAIREGVGRASEQGRPVVCHVGQRNLDSPHVAATLAGLSVLSYVARLCAEYGVRLIVPTMLHTVYPIQIERCREAYMEAGHPEDFNENDVMFLSPHHQAYAAGVISLLERENVGTNIMVGQWSGISLVIAETSSRVGCFGIGGTDQTTNMPFFVPTMDYAIIGEEMYALGSYIEKNPEEIGGIFARDIIKVTILIIILVGTVMGIAGIDLKNMMGM